MAKQRRHTAGEESHQHCRNHGDQCKAKHLQAGADHIIHLDLIQVFAHSLIFLLYKRNRHLCDNAVGDLLFLLLCLLQHHLDLFLGNLADVDALRGQGHGNHHRQSQGIIQLFPFFVTDILPFTDPVFCLCVRLRHLFGVVRLHQHGQSI